MNPTDDIGLTDFLVLVFKFFRRNFKILAATILLGTIIGSIYSFQKKEYFYSELIGFTPVLEQSTLLEILSPLNILAEEKNHQELSRLLNITINEASQIRSIEFAESRHLKTSNSPKLTDQKLEELVLIKLETYDQTIYKKLQEGLTTYLANNSYVKNLLTLELQKGKTLINVGENYLKKLDTLQLSKANNTSKITIANQPSPVDYNQAAMEVEDLKIEVETLNSFTVVSEFHLAKKPSNKYAFITTAIFVAFFTGGLLLTFLLELKNLAQD